MENDFLKMCGNPE